MRQHVKELTQQITALILQHQAPIVHPQEEIEEDNPFAPFYQLVLKAVGCEDNKRWEVEFKVDIPEFQSRLQHEKFLDWMITVKEVLDFKGSGRKMFIHCCNMIWVIE